MHTHTTAWTVECLAAGLSNMIRVWLCAGRGLQAGRPLYSLFGDFVSPSGLLRLGWRKLMQKMGVTPPLDYLYDVTNNTAVEFHANNAFALVETGVPVRVTLPTLKTLGTYDFNGANAAGMHAFFFGRVI